jgi:hypothetical protein
LKQTQSFIINHIKMKSFLLFVTVATFATVGLKAQTIIGCGFNFNWSRTETSDQTIYSPVTVGGNLYPKLGYLIKDIVAVGIGGGGGISQTTYAETDYNDLTVYKRENWFVSPFIRLYSSGNDKLRFILDCSMRYGGNKTATYVAENHTDADKSYKLIGYYLEPALSYNISDNFSIEMSIGNLRYTSTTDNTTGVISSGYYVSMGLETITGRLMWSFGNKKSEQNESLDKFE